MDYQAGRDLKNDLVQPFLGKAWPRPYIRSEVRPLFRKTKAHEKLVKKGQRA